MGKFYSKKYLRFNRYFLENLISFIKFAWIEKDNNTKI